MVIADMEMARERRVSIRQPAPKTRVSSGDA